MLTLCLAHALAGEGAAFDHGAFDTLLGAHVAPSGVDYGGLAGQRSELDAYVAALSGAELASMGRSEQMAFWINAYNALTLSLILDHYPLASIRDLDGGNPWDVHTWTVAGRGVTLNAIEHEILRPMGDPRIHAAVNCASKGCPPLASDAFTGAGLGAQLDAASAAWAKGNGIDVGDGTVALSTIFDWFGEDFTGAYGPSKHDIPGVDGKQEAGINFLAGYLDEATRASLQAGGYTVAFSEYDWSLNDR